MHDVGPRISFVPAGPKAVPADWSVAFTFTVRGLLGGLHGTAATLPATRPPATPGAAVAKLAPRQG